LHLLQRHASGFGHHGLHPNELQHHHEAEKQKNETGARRMLFRAGPLDHQRKHRGQHRRKNPMR
jgi:hypothetical protein